MYLRMFETILISTVTDSIKTFALFWNVHAKFRTRVGHLIAVHI